MSENISRVGDTENMLGQTFSIVTTNAGGNDMINYDNTSTGQSFVSSSLIISSPLTDGGVDAGTPSLLVTDFNGNPMRLTYTLCPGNGLVLGYTYGGNQIYSNDVLSLAIDNDSLKTDPNNGNCLYVSVSGMIEGSDYLICDDANNINVDINSLIDEKTLVKTEKSKIDSEGNVTGTTYVMQVNMNNLADGSTLSVGSDGLLVVNIGSMIDGKTIMLIPIPPRAAKNTVRKIAVNTSNLTKASATSYGVTKIDNSTIKSNNGSIYVDVSQTAKQMQIHPKGGVGTIKVQRQGEGDLYIDSSLILRTDPLNMPKCSQYNSTKTSKGYGVCAVDGVTIKASQNGVISAVTSEMNPATSTSLGVVKPDNSTIVVENSGTIKVSTSKLTQGSAANYGVVKYDNNTIKQNTQGQLYVNNAAQWASDIADLKTQISNLASQITSLKSQLGSISSSVSNNTSVEFTLTKSGTEVKSIQVWVSPSRAMGGSYGFTVNTQLTLNYGAGYSFSFRTTGTNDIIDRVSLLAINNPGATQYTEGSTITLVNNSIVLNFIIVVENPETSGSTLTKASSFNMDFYSSNGTLLDTIQIQVVRAAYNSTSASKSFYTINGLGTKATPITTGGIINVNAFSNT